MTAILPLAIKEEVDAGADRREICLSADDADGHKAICGLVVS